jgi:Uma2 family endonuclease
LLDEEPALAKLRGVMAPLRFPLVRSSLPELRYVRAPEPLDFPEEALKHKSKTHLVLRTFLFRLLRFALGPAHRVGSEQFLYWNAADTTVSLAPDAMVRLNVPDAQFKTWKTWEEGGVPDLAIEVVSDGDRHGEKAWSEKLSDYRAIGVKELVRFDPAAPESKRLRVWDRVREDLVERQIGEDRTPCLALGLHWVVCPVEDEPVGLRLIDDEGRLLEVPEEAEARHAAEARTREAEAETRAQAAEARVRELEEQLRRAQGGGGSGSR